MKISNVIAALEAYAPLSLQMERDNCGLICGVPETTLTGVLVTLDLTPDVAREAKEKGCNLIVEHHPSLFVPVSKLDYRLPTVEALVYAIKNDIAVYAAHTNVDFTDGGLNDTLLAALGCTDIAPVGGNREGARIGNLSAPVRLADFYRFAGEKIGGGMQMVGDPDKMVRRVAAVNGGGGDSVDAVLECAGAGADVFMSADFKYHVLRFAKDGNYAIICFGHYDSEIGFINLVAKRLMDAGFADYVKKAERCVSPFA